MNATPAAAFVTVLALGVSFAFAAAFGFWLVDKVTAWFERTETDELDLRSIRQWEQSRAALRHPSSLDERRVTRYTNSAEEES